MILTSRLAEQLKLRAIHRRQPVIKCLFLLGAAFKFDFAQATLNCSTHASRATFQNLATMTTPQVANRVDDINKSPEDKRSYRGLELGNGLKVLLVSDPTTDKAAAALDVHVGHMKDPWKLPGLAHFCEHMLFLGTEKYPDENEYNKFLSQNAGSSNAYTALDHTNYFFDVSPKELGGALDRFGQFFLKPLFTESATDREVKAVNSEHEKNVASDLWRINQLERSLSDENHDYYKFGTGNIETLDKKPKELGINVREELLAFHEKWYSSNIMSLCVLGKDSLEDLETMVLDIFARVENKDIQIPSWSDHPYKDGKTMTYVLPVKDIRQLNITFPIPDLREHYRSGPSQFLGHLIGHEGEGSLLSELKRLGYTNSLVAGQKSGSRGFDFFVINVDLTEDGIEHIEDIIQLVFQYLKLVRESGVKQWVFEELAKINAMQFRFKDKERPQNYVSSLSGRMQEYPTDEVLSGPFLLDNWNPDLINQLLEHLIPEKIVVIAVGQKFQEKTTEAELWYGTKHATEKIPDAKIEAWKNPELNDRLQLHPPNEFIPTDFQRAPPDDGHKHGRFVPTILRETPLSRLWYRQDDEFLLPKACLTFEIRSPLLYFDPHYSNLGSMFVTLFNDAMTEYAYQAELAGLYYNLSIGKYSLTLSVSGYHEKQHIFLERIISRMLDFKVDEDRFRVLREYYTRGLKNFRMEQPHSHAVYQNNVLLSEKVWTKEELLKYAIQDDLLTAEALQNFVPQLFAAVHIETLVYGNLSPKQATDMMETVEAQMKSSRPLPESLLAKGRQIQMDLQSSRHHMIENDVHKSSCVETYYQTGRQGQKENVLLELFAQIINEPCFNVLRTQEQLGYIVFSGVRRANGVQGLRIIVQSDKKPAYLETRIDAFMNTMRKHIEEMDDGEFEKNKQALADRRLEKPKKLSSRNNKYWSEITSQQYNFDRDENEVEELKKLTKDDVLKFYDDFIDEAGAKFSKVSSFVKSTVEGDTDAEDNNVTPKSEPISDLQAFKASHPLYPLMGPFSSLEALKR